MLSRSSRLQLKCHFGSPLHSICFGWFVSTLCLISDVHTHWRIKIPTQKLTCQRRVVRGIATCVVHSGSPDPWPLSARHMRVDEIIGGWRGWSCEWLIVGEVMLLAGLLQLIRHYFNAEILIKLSHVSASETPPRWPTEIDYATRAVEPDLPAPDFHS